MALREVVSGKTYVREDLYTHQGLWHSPMHHGDFSASSMDEVLQRINRRLQQASGELDRLDLRRRLSVNEIVSDTLSLLSGLLARNNRLQVVLTVSPIRHVRDGLHANQLSKATLLLAAEQVEAAFPDRVFYFPAYELLQDELRDYRFYADDLVHPSDLAVRYVWERFTQWCLSPEAQRMMAGYEEIRKALAHKPIHPESDEYKRFLEQIVLKMERLNGKYPYFDLQNERETCLTLLNRLQKS